MMSTLNQVLLAIAVFLIGVLVFILIKDKFTKKRAKDTVAVEIDEKPETTTIPIEKCWKVYVMSKTGNQQNCYQLIKNEKPIEIGRDPDYCKIVLYDQVVGKRHAYIRMDRETPFLQDRKSTNGIYYKGNKIDSISVENGMIIWIADIPVIFVEEYEGGFFTAIDNLQEILDNDILQYGMPNLT